MIFDFDFDPPIYRKTLWKACSKKKIRTCPTNFEHSSRKRGTCMKSVKWALDSDIACWHSLHRSVLDADLNSASNGSSFKRTARENMGFRVKILCFGPILLVCLAKIFSPTYVHHLITFFGSRIKFCVEWSEFQRPIWEKGFSAIPVGLKMWNTMQLLFPHSKDSLIVYIMVGFYAVGHRVSDGLLRRLSQ